MDKIVRKSVWVIFLDMFVGTILLGIIFRIIGFLVGEVTFLSIFSKGIIGAFLLFMMHVLIFLIPLIIVLYISSLIFINKKSLMNKVFGLLTGEFLIVTFILIFFAINYKFPTWYLIIPVFGFSQYRRFVVIKKELKLQTNIP